MTQGFSLSCILFRFFKTHAIVQVDAIYLRHVPAKTMTSQSWTPFPYSYTSVDWTSLPNDHVSPCPFLPTLYPSVSNKIQSRIVIGTVLFILHLLRKLRIMLLETIANALLRSHPLHHTAIDAAVFARRHSLGSEVVDA